MTGVTKTAKVVLKVAPAVSILCFIVAILGFTWALYQELTGEFFGGCVSLFLASVDLYLALEIKRRCRILDRNLKDR